MDMLAKPDWDEKRKSYTKCKTASCCSSNLCDSYIEN